MALDYTDRQYETVDCGAGTPRLTVGHELLTGDTLHPYAPDWPDHPHVRLAVRFAGRQSRLTDPGWRAAFGYSWWSPFLVGVLAGAALTLCLRGLR